MWEGVWVLPLVLLSVVEGREWLVEGEWQFQSHQAVALAPPVSLNPPAFLSLFDITLPPWAPEPVSRMAPTKSQVCPLGPSPLALQTLTQAETLLS